MTDDALDAVVVEPEDALRGCVVWLHGLGADGWDFEPVVRELGLAARGVRAVLPHAPAMPVTVNGGMRMRAWYDVRDPDLARDPDMDGILRSADLIDGILDAQIAAGIPAERIVLAGFSQGAVIALQAGLRRPARLAGLLALSGYLPRLPEPAASAPGLPVFMGHGSEDTLVPPGLGRAAAEALEALGCAVEAHTYPMAHGVSPAELADLGAWMRRVLA